MNMTNPLLIKKTIKKNRGFTLLEIVVAVAIFAVVVGIMFPALIQFLDMRERVVEKNNELVGLQKTFLFLANDLRYAASRLSKNEYGDIGKTTLSIGDDSLLDFTALYPDVRLEGLGVPRRIKWIFEENVLSRVQYPVMDPDGDTRSFKQELLVDVEDIDIIIHHVIDGRDNEEKRWQNEDRLPDMIDIELTLATGTKYRRVFTMLGDSSGQELPAVNNPVPNTQIPNS